MDSAVFSASTASSEMTSIKNPRTTPRIKLNPTKDHRVHATNAHVTTNIIAITSADMASTDVAASASTCT